MSNSDMNYVEDFDFLGVNARQIPCLTAKGEPSNELALKIGLLYINEDNGDMYKCIKGNGEECLVWALVANTNSGQNANLEQNDPEAPDYVKNRTHWAETGEATIEWDGSTDGMDVVAVGSDYTLVRVSELLPSVEAMIGRTVEMADGSSFEVSTETIEWNGLVWAVLGPVGEDILPVLYGVGATEIDGITFPDTGLYAVLYPDQPYRFARVDIAYETIHGLDAKYLPKEVVQEYVIELDYNKTMVTSNGKNVLIGKIPNDLSAADINHAHASGQRLVVRLKIDDDGVTYMRLVGCGIRHWSFEADMGSQYTADRIQKLYLRLYQSEVGSDAMTARVAYVHTVLGGDTKSVQSDLGQNDPEAPDYVKNRTHWEENNQTVIEWDGSTEGRDSVVIGDPTFYKVSDLVPTKAELIGGKVTVNGSVMEVTEDLLIEGSNCLFSHAGFAVVYDNSFSVTDSSGTANSCGVYFIGRSQAEVSKLTYDGSTIVHPLDEKWIPDSIARVRDINNGTAKWKTLEGKPFYNVNIDNVIELDEPGGGESFMYDGVTLHKVSDMILTKVELADAPIVVNSGGELFDRYITADDIVECVNGLHFFEGRYTIFFGGTFEAYDEGGRHVIIDPPSPGIYYAGNGDWIKTITVPKMTERILPSQLPDGGVGWEEKNKTTIEWDGTAETIVDTGDMLLVHISDLVPESDDLLGQTIIMADNSEFTVTRSNLLHGILGVCAVFLPNVEDPVLYVVPIAAGDFTRTGIYVVNAEDPAKRFAKMTIENRVIHKIDTKFMPEELVTEYMIEFDVSKMEILYSNANRTRGRIPNDLIYLELYDTYKSGQQLIVKLINTDYGEIYLRLISTDEREWRFWADVESTSESITKMYLTIINSDISNDGVKVYVDTFKVNNTTDTVTEQVQADLSQNDPEAPDYVKGRTHYEENNQTVIEWDGNTEGRNSFGFENGTVFYKVSDATPSAEELTGRELVIVIGGEPETVVLDENTMFTGDGYVQMSELGFVVTQTPFIYDGITVEAPSTGIYWASVGDAFSASITYGSTIVHPLDEKWIPDSIARVEDIPKVNYPVTSVNGMTGDVVIKVGNGSGSGGVSSWNDLTDKPFDYIKTSTLLEKNVTLTVMDGEPFAFAETTDVVSLEAGKTYAVSLNGEDHICVGRSFYGEMVILGNLSILEVGNDTGEPFLFVPAALSEGAEGCTICGKEATTVDFGLYEIEVTRTISAKLVHDLPVGLPEITSEDQLDCVLVSTVSQETGMPVWEAVPVNTVIGAVDVLPEVTSENNGQLLGVVDCSWAPMEAPSSLPKVTSDNNGQLLGVVDGVWSPVGGLSHEGAFLRIVNGFPTWVQIENAEDGVY